MTLLRTQKADAEATKKASLDDLEVQRTARTARPTLIEFATQAMTLDDRVHHEMELLSEFAADVAPLETAFALITAPYAIQRQTITVQIKSSGKYEALLDQATRKQRDGGLRKFTVVIEPFQPAHLSLAPAFVVSFLRNPEFSVVKKGDAFAIQQKDSQLTSYTLGAMLNITPDAWQEPTFGGYFQLGITPTKDQFGFYAGMGLRLQGLVTFGGGVMAQQIRRLADGLTVDSTLADPADLKTDTHFKPGFYLHLTVDLPK